MLDFLADLNISPMAAIALALLFVFLGIIAVRFDLNRWQEMRYQRKKERVRLLCPHVEFVKRPDNTIECLSLYISPPGTFVWQCQRCGNITHDSDSERTHRKMVYWGENFNVYSQRIKKINKIIRHL